MYPKLMEIFIYSFWASNPLRLFSSSSVLHFAKYSFLVHHPVNLDNQHLLVHALASDFTVAWQFSQREQLRPML
jgi:hypothetical protein